MSLLRVSLECDESIDNDETLDDSAPEGDDQARTGLAEELTDGKPQDHIICTACGGIHDFFDEQTEARKQAVADCMPRDLHDRRLANAADEIVGRARVNRAFALHQMQPRGARSFDEIQLLHVPRRVDEF